MMNFKPTLIVLLSVFVIAELIAETESILFGKTIQSENEKVCYHSDNCLDYHDPLVSLDLKQVI